MRNISKKINAYLVLQGKKTKDLCNLLNKRPASTLNNIKHMTFRLDELVAILDLDNNFLVVLNADKSIAKIYHKNNLPFNTRVYKVMKQLDESNKHLAIINDRNEILFELFLDDLKD